MNRQQERFLIAKAQAGCDVSMNRLFEAHYPWWLKKCREFVRHEMTRLNLQYESCLEFETDDLLAVCFENLKRAVKAFDLDRNYRLLTYCGRNVWQWCFRFIQEECKPLKFVDQAYLEETQPAIADTTLKVDHELQNAEYRRVILEALGSVANSRERQIVELRFLSEQPLTLKQVGDLFGLTKQRIAQIQTRCLEAVRKHLSENNLELMIEFQEGGEV